MKQFIKCPYCDKIQLGECFCHECINCKVYIMDSEWCPIPALSIKQPWSWLIVNGYKDLENRNTLKNFRGDFLIHASLQYDFEWRDKLPKMNFREKCKIDKVLSANFKLMKRGGIIGHATIIDSITKSDSPWFSGKYAFVMKDQKTLPFTPCKGKLSFFNPEIL